MVQLMHNELAILIIAALLSGLLIWSIRSIIITHKPSYAVYSICFLIISALLIYISMGNSSISNPAPNPTQTPVTLGNTAPASTTISTPTLVQNEPNQTTYVIVRNKGSTPAWAWVVMGLGIFLILCVIILIIRTRRV